MFFGGWHLGRLGALAGVSALMLFSATLGSADLSGVVTPSSSHALYADLYNPATKTLKRGRRDRNLVCLTIDDAPYGGSLPRILEILREYQAKATFFMVGKRIVEFPHLVREVLKEGHEVGNHTENHYRLNHMSPDQVRVEIALCAEHYRQATGGGKMKYFRAPGMRSNATVDKIIRDFGYINVLANYAGKDFRLTDEGPTVTSAEDIAQNVLNNVTPGGIILLHDVPETAEALPTILEGLEERGFKVVTVSELIQDLPKG